MMTAPVPAAAIGYIYAIESGDAVKIGFAKDPVRRLSELNVGSPGAHRLLGYIVGTKADEAKVHVRFREYRIRGEWFRNEGAVSEFVSGLSLMPFGPIGCSAQGDVAARAKARPRCIGTPKSQLHNFLLLNSLSDEDFARMVGGNATPRSVRKWKYGETYPRLQELVRIEAITGGEVRGADLVRAHFRDRFREAA